MSDGNHVLTQAITAARAQDYDTLQGLIDWPLTGAADLSRALAGVREPDRTTVVASGLAELDAAASRPDLVAEILADAAPRLAAAREIRVAQDAQHHAVLAALQVTPPPPGLTDEQRARLTALQARAATLHDVYLVVSDTGELPVVVTPDTGRLVLLLPPA
jgi:hypothetical protein